ncbi:MAG: ABC transporter permease [Ruminococcus sp.]|nr:ABC transporter permease [Ruminococcus sp.]MBQ7218415.1 ABC transporter permease [Ruminococcus sp.]
MRTLTFASRNTKEITRDLLTLIFGVAFPLVLLVLLSAINKSIPDGYGPTNFLIENLAPGITVFGLSFLSLFASMLIAKDRTTSFVLRLFTSPIRPAEFILGYTLPLLPMALVQSLVCYACALFFGLQLSANLLLAIVVNIPIAVVFIALGLLFGSVLSEKAVGGVCGALLTNLSAWFSNIWFDTSMVGGAFETVANILPFSHAVKAAQATVAGDYTAIFPDLWWVIAYAVVLTVAAVAVFAAKLKKN